MEIGLAVQFLGLQKDTKVKNVRFFKTTNLGFVFTDSFRD